jgi:hypothetical protein
MHRSGARAPRHRSTASSAAAARVRSASERFVAVSSGVLTRSIEIGTPLWARRRAPARAASQCGKNAASNRSASGRGETRTIARVRIPMRPSDPSTMWRRSGPAAEAGNGGSRRIPAGVTTVPPANRSSMRPWPRLCCPLERVAIHPPRLLYSNDCG